MADEKFNSSNYILATGHKGFDNLNLQNEIFKSESYRQLNKAGLKKGMIVWDIGCGSGSMTEYLAKMVGEEGKVYAIDTSFEQIAITKQRIEKAGLSNVVFLVGNINDIDSKFYSTADLAYSRFILMHVTDPQSTVQSMARVLKRTGALLLNESSMLSWSRKKDTHSTVNEYFDLILQYGKQHGFDYDVGYKLTHICKSLNIFSKVQSYVKEYQTCENAKKLIMLRFAEMKPQLVEKGLITETKYKLLQDNMIKFFADKNQCKKVSIIPDQYYVIAYKK